MLPVATKEGVVTPFSDALFTATSAVCVTGLVVHDTATYWSNFGQFIIVLLIQIGGLGVVTVAGAFGILSGRRIGLMQRSTMQNAISAHKVGGHRCAECGRGRAPDRFYPENCLGGRAVGGCRAVPRFLAGIRLDKGTLVCPVSLYFRLLQCGIRLDGDQGALFVSCGLRGQPGGLRCDPAANYHRRHWILDLG